MDDTVNDGKRDFLKSAAVLGVASSMIGATAAPREALAPMLETGIREDSSLAKVRKEGVQRVVQPQSGRSRYHDPNTGQHGGSSKHLVDSCEKEQASIGYAQV